MAATGPEGPLTGRQVDIPGEPVLSRSRTRHLYRRSQAERVSGHGTGRGGGGSRRTAIQQADVEHEAGDGGGRAGQEDRQATAPPIGILFNNNKKIARSNNNKKIAKVATKGGGPPREQATG